MHWLETAVFYQVYPQSYFDTNADGIGDINGIIEKLPYIKDLGCNAIWINPCFDSPFRDAGYDVRDFKKVAPRYGTNEDLVRCFSRAHELGMHVLLDLVPGHTSDEHPWFLASQKKEHSEYSNRYVWTPNTFIPAANYNYVAGKTERDGCYLLNFFYSQPALNYGFGAPEAPWQLPTDHPDALATREAMKDVIRYWLSQGCDGFRVDMAGTIVKNDDESFSATAEIWRDVRAMLDDEYPKAVLVSEWGTPMIALNMGFHCDLLLSHTPAYHSLMRDYGSVLGIDADLANDHSYFRRESNTSIQTFLDGYLPHYNATKDKGHISFTTCNHDTIRPAFNLDEDELAVAFAFLFTMPGVPFLYYGDEIAMRYLAVPNKEGGYFRTGSRTPMQWSQGKNFGFSANDAPYLPTDTAPDAPTVESSRNRAHSLFNRLRGLLKLRAEEQENLRAGASFDIVHVGKRCFVYRRGQLCIALNPGTVAETIPLTFQGAPLWHLGELPDPLGAQLQIPPQSFCIYGE